MRKLITLLAFLLPATLASAQSPSSRILLLSGGGCPQAAQYLARTGGANRGLTTKFICNLVAKGTWSKIVVLYFFATDTAAHAVLNSVEGSGNFDASPVSSPTFTRNVGFTFNGVSSYLNTKFIPSSNGSGLYGLNSSGLFVCNQTNNSGLYIDMGAYDGTTVTEISANYIGSAVYPVNTVGDVLGVPTYTSNSGTFAAVRTGSNSLSFYHGASSTPILTSTQISVAFPAVSIYVAARNQGGGATLLAPRQYSFAGITSGMSGIDYLNLRTEMSSYMNGLGIGGC